MPRSRGAATMVCGRSRLRPHGGFGIVLGGMVALAGCQHFPRASSAWPPPAAAEKGSTLTEGQVADVQVALGRELEKRGQVEEAIQAYTLAPEKGPDGDGVRAKPTSPARRADACARLAVLHDRQGKF